MASNVAMRMCFRAIAFSLLAISLTRGASAVAACVGDCNGDGNVDIDELVRSVNIALDSAPLETCASADPSGDGTVTVDELIAAVNVALTSCPAVDTPTPTVVSIESSPTPLATATMEALTPTATPTPLPPGTIPTTAHELTAWLQAGMYRNWTAESAAHPSGGPHGGTVRTFLNDLVLESLAAGNSAHPAGAALVKELYFSGSTVRNWAVEVKIQSESAGGSGWYWYEGEALSGVGLRVCTSCHGSDFGSYVSKDYVLTPFPLQ